jgi:hypothetical protein
LGGEYSSYSFLTFALDGVSGQRHAPPLFVPGKGPLVPNGQKAGGAHSRFGHRLKEKSFASAGDRTSVAGRPVCSHTLYWLSYHLLIYLIQ